MNGLHVVQEVRIAQGLLDTMCDGMARDRGAGTNFERWINLGIARFETTEVMNAIIDLVYLSRERL